MTDLIARENVKRSCPMWPLTCLSHTGAADAMFRPLEVKDMPRAVTVRARKRRECSDAVIRAFTARGIARRSVDRWRSNKQVDIKVRER